MAKKTNTATQETRPPDDVLAQYRALMDRASGVSGQPYQSTVAPFNPQQEAAFGQFGQIPGQYLPQAEGYAQEGAAPITGDQIESYTNPFQKDVTDATLANIKETNAEQQNQITGNAIAQGALGGNRVGVAQGELARQQGLANNATLAGLNATNYQQALAAAQADREAKARGAGQFGNLQTQAIQGATAELGSGQVQQDQGSQELQNRAAFPYQQLSWLDQIFGNTGPLEGSSTKQTTPGPSIWSSILGGGLALAGLPTGSIGAKGLKALGLANGGVAGPRMAYAPGGIALPFMSDAGQPAGGGVPGGQPGLLSRATDFLHSRLGGEGQNSPQPAPQGGIGGLWGGQNPVAALKQWLQSRAGQPQQGLIPAFQQWAKSGFGQQGGGGPGQDFTSLGGIGGLPHFDDGGGVGTLIPNRSGMFDVPEMWGSPVGAPSADVTPAPTLAAPDPLVPIGWAADKAAPAPSGGIGSPVTAALAAATGAPPPTATMADASGDAPTDPNAGPPMTKGRGLNIPLIAAGLGMMASQSPFLGTAIGQGGMAGIQAYTQQQTNERTLAQQKAEADYRNASLDLQAQRLDQSAKQQAASLALTTASAYQPKWSRIGTDASGQPQYGWVDPKTGTITDQGGKPVTGAPSGPDVNAKAGDTYAALPKAQQGIVDQMLDGRLPVPSGTALKTPYWQNLLEAANDKEAAAGNPSGFDASKWTARNATRKEFESGGPNLPAGTITSGNTAIQHLGQLYESVDKLGNFGGVPFVNYALNAGKNAVAKGSGTATALSAFNSIRDKYVEEATKFYRGVGGTQEDIKRDIAVLDAANSPAELKTAIQTQVHLMQSKVNALQSRWQTVFGPDQKFQIIQPESQKYIDEIEGKQPAPAAVAGKPAATPPAQYPNAKQAPDGNWYVPNPVGGYFMVQP